MNLGVAQPADLLPPTEGPEPRRDPVEPDRLPLWFTWVLTIGLAGIAGLGISGLALAVVGHDSRWGMLLIGLPSVAVLTFLARPGRSRGRRATRTATLCAIGVLVVAGASFAVNASHSAEHVVVDGDPSVYLSTGRWLASHGNLEAEERVGPFATAPGIGFTAPGVFDSSRTTIEFQFSHLLAALLADGHWIGGDSWMLGVPAALTAVGLLAMYALANRALRRPVVALMVVTAYSVSLPFIFISRDTFSESATLPLLWGGLWLWTRALDRRSLRLGVAAGLVLGATMCNRIDAIVYLAALPAAVAILCVLDRRQRRRDATAATGRSLSSVGLATLVAVVPPALLGTFDLAERSTAYYDALRSEVHQLYALVAASVVLAVAIMVVDVMLARRRRGPSDRAARAWSWLTWVLPAGAIVAVLGLWLVRPHVQTATSSLHNTYIALLQQMQGLPSQPNRTYDEQTMRWLSWYLGPVTIALAALGAGVVVWHFLRGRGRSTLYPAIALGLGTSLYVWRSSVNPFQLWASRRFAPAAVPFVLVLAGATISLLAYLVARRLRPSIVAMGGVIAAAVLIAGSLIATWPLKRLSSQAHYLDAVTRSCGVLGPDAAVVAVQGDYALSFIPALRSWCNVPVAWVPSSTSPARLTELAQEWAASGKKFYVTAGVSTLAKLVPGAAPTIVGPIQSNTNPVPTIEGLPKHLMSVPVTFAFVRVPA
jgi:hypothetical protein